MKKFKWTVIFIVIFIFICSCFFDEEKDITNEGDSTYTLMIYMLASDLESDGGYATDDIAEMLKGYVDEKVNVILETGGTSKWMDYGISNKKIQRYIINNGDLKLVDELKQAYMTDPNTLTDFINYSVKKYKADRYGLILWDHGGGSVSGYGYDENNPDEDDTMRIDELQESLKNANVKFDFIGFDACLMASFETAYAVKDYASYLIASEETEPGSGWSYEELLDNLSSNTDQDTIDIGKNIIDNFVSNNDGFFGSDATLSIIDLSKVDNVLDKLNAFSKTIKDNNLVNNNSFKTISKSIENTKSFGDGEYDMLDLYHLASNINNNKSKELIESLQDIVVYNNTTSINNANGISIYIPFNDLSYYKDMLEIYNNIGIKGDYINFLNKFVNIIAGGKKETKGMKKDDNINYEEESWYNDNIKFDFGKLDDYGDLEITESGDEFILELSDKMWSNINNITQEVFYYDDGVYYDLGSDDYYELDEDTNLIVSYDGVWLTVNGNIVAYYADTTVNDYCKGYIPALVNDNEVELIVVWDNKKANLIGYRNVNYGNTTLASKSIELKKGDIIEFLMDTYNEDGDYIESIVTGSIKYDSKKINVEYNEIEAASILVYYKIIDIYNNEYFTEPVVYE